MHSSHQTESRIVCCVYTLCCALLYFHTCMLCTCNLGRCVTACDNCMRTCTLLCLLQAASSSRLSVRWTGQVTTVCRQEVGKSMEVTAAGIKDVYLEVEEHYWDAVSLLCLPKMLAQLCECVVTATGLSAASEAPASLRPPGLVIVAVVQLFSSPLPCSKPATAESLTSLRFWPPQCSICCLQAWMDHLDDNIILMTKVGLATGMSQAL